MDRYFGLSISALCVVFVGLAVACSGSVAAPVREGNAAAENGTTVILVENTSISLSIKQLKPDRVELIYFHTKNPCYCMAVVGDSIEYAVDTYFKNEVAGGQVALSMIVSDDPANAGTVKKYDAMAFSLFIREVRGDSERVYPVSEIWEMTGDANKDRLVDFIRVTLGNALDGKGQ
ncbi:MAG: hypothetical protein NTV42_09295 [Chloroflexi bacterium]|nr:hypothetical protein [Chloroflexota bacterium]